MSKKSQKKEIKQLTATQRELIAPTVNQFLQARQGLFERLGLIDEGFLDGSLSLNFETMEVTEAGQAPGPRLEPEPTDE